MGQWLTVEYAARLAGVTPRTILRGVASGRLRHRKDASRRHEGKEYTLVDLDSLPVRAQRSWVELHGGAGRSRVYRMQAAALPVPDGNEMMPEPEPAPVPAGDVAPTALSEEQLAWARYRFSIIEPLVSGAWATMIGDEIEGVKVRSKSDLVRAYARRTWLKPNGRTEQYSESGIYKILRRFREGGMAALANDERSDKGTTKLTLPMQDMVIAAYCSGGSAKYPEKRSVAQVCRMVAQERELRALRHAQGQLLDDLAARGFKPYTDAQGNPAPSEFYLFPPISDGSIARFLRGIPKAMQVFSREGEDRYKAKCEPYILRDYESLRPMQYVVFDHRRCDIFVLYKKNGRLVLMRPWETVALDMKSRMVLASVMCETPSALSVASCVRQIVLKFGKFEHAYLDNGKEFTAQYIDGKGLREGQPYRQDFDGPDFDSTRGIFGQLGIQVVHAHPFNARGKIIEPSFRNPAYYERTLAGACGNRPPNRPEFLADWEKEFRRWDPNTQPDNHPFMSYERFHALKQHFYFEDYNRRPHTGRGMNERSPEQVMREEYIDLGMARMVDPRALDLLLQKRRLRTVAQGGTLVARFGGEDYVFTHPNLFLLQGREVETSYDPYDLGEMTVFHDNRYICTARCQMLHGMGEREIEEPIKEQRRILRDMRRALDYRHSITSLPSPAEHVAIARELVAAKGLTAPLSLEGTAVTDRLPERYEEAVAAAEDGTDSFFTAEFPSIAAEEVEPEAEIRFLGSAL